MKKKIHPEYDSAQVRCACGTVIETRSTTPGTIQVEVCSSCHPFFTGKQKLMDTAGRIDRFTKKFGKRLALGGHKKIKKAAPVKAVKPAKEEKEAKGEAKDSKKK